MTRVGLLRPVPVMPALVRPAGCDAALWTGARNYLIYTCVSMPLMICYACCVEAWRQRELADLGTRVTRLRTATWCDAVTL